MSCTEIDHLVHMDHTFNILLKSSLIFPHLSVLPDIFSLLSASALFA